jgi:transcriptional regulator with XRE-family HTH domain
VNNLDTEIKIGPTVRALRKSREITIIQLAEACCLSPNTISLIESDKVAPTLTSLCKIALALQVPITALFAELCPSEIILRRLAIAGDGKSQKTLSTLAAVNGLLSETTTPEAQMILCLSGHLRMKTLTDSYDLGSGDYISYLGSVLHCCQNLSEQTSILIWIIPAKQPSQASRGGA